MEVIVWIGILGALVGVIYFGIKDFGNTSTKKQRSVDVLENHKMVNPNPGEEWW